MELVLGIIPTSNPSLISNNYKPVAISGSRASEFEDTINELKSVAMVNIAMIDINDAVSIEQ